MLLRVTMFAALLFFVGVPAASAQDVSSTQVDELAREVSRVESVRAVKDLQRTYAQYAQFGLWDEMATLFSRDARIVWGEETISGPAALANWLKSRVGGQKGLAPGALHFELIDSE